MYTYVHFVCNVCLVYMNACTIMWSKAAAAGRVEMYASGGFDPRPSTWNTAALDQKHLVAFLPNFRCVRSLEGPICSRPKLNYDPLAVWCNPMELTMFETAFASNQIYLTFDIFKHSLCQKHLLNERNIFVNLNGGKYNFMYPLFHHLPKSLLLLLVFIAFM
jgi:hypothetical protein